MEPQEPRDRSARTEEETVYECPLHFGFQEEEAETAAGEARARLTPETLILQPPYGDALVVPLRDITALDTGDTWIRIAMGTGETVLLSRLGYRFDDFLRNLQGERNELLLRDLLMQETRIAGGIRGRVRLGTPGAGDREDGCELRLYDTALVILPDGADPLRIPYGCIGEVREEDYQVLLTDDRGMTVVLSHLGRGYGPFVRHLSETMNRLSARVQELVRDLVPGAGPGLLRRAGRLLREGRAARRSDLVALSPDLWDSLESRIDRTGIGEEYRYLCSVGRADQTAVGIKRGLTGDPGGEYIWFLVPLPAPGTREPATVMAMEASPGGGGRATYFFRIAGPEEEAAAEISRCMLSINFRREPVYLREDQLETPHFARYRTAVERIPELGTLRERYIGRVFHRSQAQWEQDVEALRCFAARVPAGRLPGPEREEPGGESRDEAP